MSGNLYAENHDMAYLKASGIHAPDAVLTVRDRGEANEQEGKNSDDRGAMSGSSGGGFDRIIYWYA